MRARLLELHLKAMDLRGDRGATAVEYALMVALIAMVIIGAVTALGANLNGIFKDVATSF